MVEFVRDRFESDVHVMVNSQFSNSGGEQNQMNFIGQQRFQGLTDTLTYFNDPTATDDDKRKQLVKYLKLGLTRYVAKTDAGKYLEITFAGTDTTKSSKTFSKKDPWNYWVFQFGGSANFNGSRNYQSNSLYGYVNADQETEEWKNSFYVSADKSKQIFKDDSTESKFESKSYSAGVQIAKSINKHWSYGISAGYQNYFYSNIKAGFSLKPKIEYSLFPYSKFNSQRIVFQYMVGPIHNKYYDTTVYFKTKELQLEQSLNIITSFNQPWGNINIGIFWSNYFDDFSKNNLSFNGAINWKIAKGLNFGLYGYYALVHDQIALRKGGASRDELLIRNKELFSSFEYNLGFGFSYRFGSISNSTVNPRFKGLSYSVSF